ncbi:winged helix-turn-helix transcriptional regulator [Gluconacetobacter sacchari]|uniref:winged helix-turn-helix transcriptional regulator n=1 Tax=Gluconacetobacter sacchari TaxID=92759 RepID=UPI0039B58D57
MGYAAMRSKGFERMACSVAAVMGAIGDRWGMLVMRDLILGLRRYDDLCRSTGVTNATLADRLGAEHVRALAGRGADDLMRWRLNRSS